MGNGPAPAVQALQSRLAAVFDMAIEVLDGVLEKSWPLSD
jgi:hypothetical protein